MKAFVFTSKSRNDVVVIIADSSFEASTKLNDMIFLTEGATDYIYSSSVNCVRGEYCTATII